MSKVVGKDGRVVAHSNIAYLQFVGDEFKARHADDRLPNVDVLMAENNELALDANQFDAITMVLSFHDTYWISPEEDWPEFDHPKLYAELFASLKPGGVLGVVDHQAEPGSSSDTDGTLHRIDRAIAVADFEAAGIRGNTDRFVLRFRKPE